MKRSSFFLTCFSLLLFSCQPEEEITKDPVSELNALVKPLGFIGFQNAMDRGEQGTHTGILVGGRPTALSYVANFESCFPQNDFLPRYQDRANIQRKYDYTFQGNLGFLTLGIPIVSAGFGLQESMKVNLELDGLVIEYLDSVDITDWYREGMRETCRDYLKEVGFLIQTIHTQSMRLSIQRVGGTNIGLNADNVNDFFQFEAGVAWEIIDGKTIEITSPHTLGYQIALMKPDDQGQVLYRAMSTEDDSFVFEAIGFSDFFNQDNISQNPDSEQKGPSSQIDQSQHIFLN